MPTTTSQPPDRYIQILVTIESLYNNYLAPNLPPPIAAVLSNLISAAIQAQPYISQVTSLFTSLVSTLAGKSGGSAESTALVSTAVMILTLYVSLRVFNYMRRMVLGWVIFAIKVVVVLVGVQVMLYVNRYGWENAIKDASWWGGIVWGFIEELLEGNNGKDGGRAPRGTRSRGSAKQKGQYAYQGRDQVPVGGGRTRWT